MRDKCFDQGIIQAYVDGELASDLSKTVLRHLNICEECAQLLCKTEEENAFAFSVLEDQLGVFVPTERLREKVFASIKDIERERKRSVWTRLTENFTFLEAINFRNPSVLALGCTLMFVGTFALAMEFFPKRPTIDSVVVSNEFDPVRVGLPSSTDSSVDEGESPEVKPDTTKPVIVKIRQNKNSSSGFRPMKISGTHKPSAKRVNPNLPAVEGESAYLQTIAALDKSIENSKDDILAPGERITFEKDIALVNIAIKNLRTELRKDPKNEAAKQILKATYQNKIDLLNSVSEKNELMVSMQ